MSRSSPASLRLATLMGLSLLAGCSGLSGQGGADQPSAPATQQSANSLQQAAVTAMQPFLQRPEWEGFRNLTAGAQGILIVPSAIRVGFIVGAELGSGILMARHGNTWSDPVFVKLSNYNVGFLAGASDSTLVMLLLSKSAISDFVEGSSRLSGSGGITLGQWGVGGLGAGGIAGGAQAITVATSSGLFAGGGFGSAQLSIDHALNTAAYGAGFNAMSILSRSGEQQATSAPLRAELGRAAQRGFSGGY